MLSKEEIKEIKKALPRGFIKELATRCELSKSTVEKFFSGYRYNITIHSEAIKLGKENTSKIEKLKSKISA